MEIQKAEEFAIDVFDAIYGNHLSWIDREDGAEGRRNGAVLIRARDKAIIERCAQRAIEYMISNTRGNEMILDDLYKAILRDLD